MERCLFLLVILSASLISLAQDKGMYISAGVSKDLAAGKQAIGTNYTASSEENIVSTFGKGFSFGPTIGYMFNENIGLEANLLFFSGKEIQFKYNEGTARATSLINSSMIRVIPAIKITTGNKIKPYAKFGFVLGLKPIIEQSIQASNQNLSYTEEDEFSGGSSFGFMGTLGSDFSLSRVTAFFLELKLINQTWGPEKVYYKVSSIGSNQSGSYVFVDQLSHTSTNQLLKQYYSFSSLGINAGLKFNLTSRKEVKAN